MSEKSMWQFAVATPTPEASERAQKALFKMNHWWTGPRASEIQHTDAQGLMVARSGLDTIHYASDVKWMCERACEDQFDILTVEQIEAKAGIVPERRLGVGNNPKQGIGSTQLPMGLVSPLFKAYVACAKHNGKGKYGLANFIGTEVVMSIYLDAAERHLDKLKMGEWADPADNVPHIGAIGACLDIITAAKAAGTLIDDRPRSDGQLEGYYALTPLVKELTELHKDKDPYHYYMRNRATDNPESVGK